MIDKTNIKKQEIELVVRDSKGNIKEKRCMVYEGNVMIKNNVEVLK
jgi:hypothetical protein